MIIAIILLIIINIICISISIYKKVKLVKTKEILYN
jgi:hypothetical protein